MPTLSAPVFSENDIRPDDLAAGQEACFASDIRRLMARRADFVEVSCPACATHRRRPAFEKFGMAFVECDACRTIYASPRPTPAMLEHYYATSENYAYFREHIYPASEPARREKLVRPRVARLVDLVRRHGCGTGTLLEVGAGFGTFCMEVISAGVFDRVLAIEPTPGLAETCRQRGLEVLEARVEETDPRAAEADVVVSFEVLEHLFDPRVFVEACARFLKPGGLLLLTCPNGRGFDIELLGPVSDAVDVQHLNLLNPAAITQLLQSCGFEMLEVTTPGRLDAELVRKKVRAGRFELGTDAPFLRRVLLEDWESLGSRFQDFLAETGLSSHMWAAACKPVAAAPAPGCPGPARPQA